MLSRMLLNDVPHSSRRANVNYVYRNPSIQQKINHYEGRGRSTDESGLRRSGVYMKMAPDIKKKACRLTLTAGPGESAWETEGYVLGGGVRLRQFILYVDSSVARDGMGLMNVIVLTGNMSISQVPEKVMPVTMKLGMAIAAYNTGAGNIASVASHARQTEIWADSILTLRRKRGHASTSGDLIAKNRKISFRGIAWMCRWLMTWRR